MPRPIKEQFTHRFAGKSTGLSKILNLKGYYQTLTIGHWESGYGKVFTKGDSTYSHMIFYEDGSCYDAQEVFFTKAEADSRMNTIGKDKDSLWFYEGDMWGIYELHKDTIVVQRIRRAHSANDHWTASEGKYLVVNKSTVQRLDFGRSLYLRRPSEPYKGDRAYPAANFVPQSYLPPPDSWMKQLDWFHSQPIVETRTPK